MSANTAMCVIQAKLPQECEGDDQGLITSNTVCHLARQWRSSAEELVSRVECAPQTLRLNDGAPPSRRLLGHPPLDDDRNAV